MLFSERYTLAESYPSMMLRRRLEDAAWTALATAERVQQRVMTEENKEKVRSMMEKIGNAVEELVDEGIGTSVAQEEEWKMNLTYVTDRLIAMGYPKRPEIVAEYFQSHHRGQFMILNVSEESYDYQPFEEQVLEYKFPGHPAPPLGMLFKMCASVESWIDADPQNVIAVHCLTGRGRTSVVLACAAAWLGLFETTFEALSFIAKKREESVDRLTIPSQRRYAQYFANVLDGVAPRTEPVVLRRAIMSKAPLFSEKGCCPYLQFFKAGKLAYTSTKFETSDRTDDELDLVTDEPRWAKPEDGPLVFEINCVVHGDILLRCRHLDAKGTRISMFRAALHAGYAPLGVLRLAKSQLDGACSDDRFPPDFELDLIFEAASPNTPLEDDHTPTAYDQLLHKDSRFWSEVRARKRRASEKRPTQKETSNNDLLVNETPSSVFAIGDEHHHQVVAEEESPMEKQNASTEDVPAASNACSTDDLLQQLDDAMIVAEEEEEEPVEEEAAKEETDVDLLERELAEAVQGDEENAGGSGEGKEEFDIDDFENYLSELGGETTTTKNDDGAAAV